MLAAPTTDDKLLRAARQVVIGINANPALWVTRPIATAVQTTEANTFPTAMQGQVAKKAAAELATLVKTDKKAIIKANLSRLKLWAEGIVGRNDPRLNHLGFNAPTAGKPLAKPGQPEELEACNEKPTGEFESVWKNPSGGDKQAGYQILRKLAAGRVFISHTAASKKATSKIITAQPTNSARQFRISAFNDSGDSLSSNTVEVKL
jgi:hypothetical protein